MEQAFEMKKKSAEISEKKKNRGICYFLLSLLEDETYTHVQWTNKQKAEFQIHWVHASSGAWERDTDAETFRLWAMAKGKLEGRENKNKTWKANFRCAMKSRPELQEIKLPKDSPQRKKNLKFWKFVDIDIVKEYEGGRTFEWRYLRNKSLGKKSHRVQPLRSTQNKGTAERKESPTSLSRGDSRTSDERQKVESPDDEEDNNVNSYGTGLLHIIDSYVGNKDGVAKEKPFEGRLQVDMDDDNNFGSYGAGLLKIIERNEEDKRTTLSPTSCGNAAFSPSREQPVFHRMSSAFYGEATFPDAKITTKRWELLMDVGLEEMLKSEGMATSCFFSCNESLASDDWDSNDMYNQL